MEAPVYRNLSQGISWVLHPFVLPVYVMVLVLTRTVFALYPADLKLYLGAVVTLYTILLPLLSLGLLKSMGRVSDWRIDLRRERIGPLAIGIVCYLLCALTIARIPSAVFLRKFMVAAACCEGLCLVVTLRWKISLHLAAMGAVVALLVLMSLAGAGDMMWPLSVAVVCSGLLASARLYLGCHNAWQVLAGFGGGFTVAALAVLFL